MSRKATGKGSVDVQRCEPKEKGIVDSHIVISRWSDT